MFIEACYWKGKKEVPDEPRDKLTRYDCLLISSTSRDALLLLQEPNVVTEPGRGQGNANGFHFYKNVVACLSSGGLLAVTQWVQHDLQWWGVDCERLHHSYSFQPADNCSLRSRSHCSSLQVAGSISRSFSTRHLSNVYHRLFCVLLWTDSSYLTINISNHKWFLQVSHMLCRYWFDNFFPFVNITFNCVLVSKLKVPYLIIIFILVTLWKLRLLIFLISTSDDL